jgi:hypothetical protein
MTLENELRLQPKQADMVIILCREYFVAYAEGIIINTKTRNMPSALPW